MKRQLLTSLASLAIALAPSELDAQGPDDQANKVIDLIDAAAHAEGVNVSWEQAIGIRVHAFGSSDRAEWYLNDFTSAGRPGTNDLESTASRLSVFVHQPWPAQPTFGDHLFADDRGNLDLIEGRFLVSISAGSLFEAEDLARVASEQILRNRDVLDAMQAEYEEHFTAERSIDSVDVEALLVEFNPEMIVTAADSIGLKGWDRGYRLHAPDGNGDYRFAVKLLPRTQDAIAEYVKQRRDTGWRWFLDGWRDSWNTLQEVEASIDGRIVALGQQANAVYVLIQNDEATRQSSSIDTKGSDHTEAISAESLHRFIDTRLAVGGSGVVMRNPGARLIVSDDLQDSAGSTDRETPAETGAPLEYEVHGVVQNVRGGEKHYWDFSVYVRGCSWLIETVGRDADGLPFQRRVLSPRGGRDVLWVTYPLAEQEGRRPGATIATIELFETMPDSGLFDPLWMMFASNCELAGRTELSGPSLGLGNIAGQSDLIRRVRWESAGDGIGLPMRVMLMDRGRDARPQVIYTADETLSTNGVSIARSFRFHTDLFGRVIAIPPTAMEEGENGSSAGGLVTVTRFLPQCSRFDLSPELPEGLIVTDHRFAEWGLGQNSFSYTIDAVTSVPSYEEARWLVAGALNRPEQQAQFLAAGRGGRPASRLLEPDTGGVVIQSPDREWMARTIAGAQGYLAQAERLVRHVHTAAEQAGLNPVLSKSGESFRTDFVNYVANWTVGEREIRASVKVFEIPEEAKLHLNDHRGAAGEFVVTSRSATNLSAINPRYDPEIGDASSGVGGSVQFWQDRFYIRIQVSEPGRAGGFNDTQQYSRLLINHREATNEDLKRNREDAEAWARLFSEQISLHEAELDAGALSDPQPPSAAGLNPDLIHYFQALVAENSSAQSLALLAMMEGERSGVVGSDWTVLEREQELSDAVGGTYEWRSSEGRVRVSLSTLQDKNAAGNQLQDGSQAFGLVDHMEATYSPEFDATLWTPLIGDGSNHGGDRFSRIHFSEDRFLVWIDAPNNLEALRWSKAALDAIHRAQRAWHGPEHHYAVEIAPFRQPIFESVDGRELLSSFGWETAAAPRDSVGIGEWDAVHLCEPFFGTSRYHLALKLFPEEQAAKREYVRLRKEFNWRWNLDRDAVNPVTVEAHLPGEVVALERVNNLIYAVIQDGGHPQTSDRPTRDDGDSARFHDVVAGALSTSGRGVVMRSPEI